MKSPKFLVAVIALIFISINIFAQSPKCENLQNDFLNNKELKNAAVGLYAENITTGEIVLDYNSNASLTPASIQKLFTTTMAMEALGSTTRSACLRRRSAACRRCSTGAPLRGS